MTFSANPFSSAPFSADKERFAGNGVSGALTATNANDTLAASGTVTAPPITGTIAATSANDTLSASGTVTPPPVTGSIAATNGNDTLAASGTVTPPPVSGSIAATGGNDTLNASGTVTNPPAPPPSPSFGAGGGGSFVPDESEQRLGYKRRRAMLRQAITEAVEGHSREKVLEVLAPYLPPPKPERVEKLKGADYILSRINWAQMADEMVRVQDRLQAIAIEQEEEEAFLLL